MKKTVSILLMLAIALSALLLPAAPASAANGCWLQRSLGDNTLASNSGGVAFSGSSSSGSLVDKYGSYPAGNAFDGRLRTAWAENYSDFGYKAFLQGSWRATQGSCTVSGVALWAGYQKNDDIYRKNCRPKDVTISLYDSSFQTLREFSLTLDDYQGCQYIFFDSPLSFSDTLNVRLTLLSVYGGSKYSDTCVSEMDLVLASTSAGQDQYLGDMRVVNCNEWVSLRSAPSTSASRLAKIPLGQIVRDCYRASSGFVYGSYNGLSGYVAAQYLTSAGSTGSNPPQKETDTGYPKGEIYENSLYALFNGITDAEYRAFMLEHDKNSRRRKNEYSSVSGIPVGDAGTYSVTGDDAAAFLANLLKHDWYEENSSGIEPLLKRASQIKLTQSELYAWENSNYEIRNVDEYYRFSIYVPYWGGGYDLFDVLFNVGYEVDGGEWAEGKVLGNTHVDTVE